MSRSKFILKESKKDVKETQRVLNRQLREFRKKFKKKRRPKTTVLYWYLIAGVLWVLLSVIVLIYIFHDFLFPHLVSIGELIKNLGNFLLNSILSG
jgi:hypothetical protein